MGFRQIFEKVMNHAVQNGEQEDIHRFIDCLTQIILDLAERMPDTYDELQQSREMIDVITSYDFGISDSAHLNSIKSKIYLIQDIIHLNGLTGITIESIKQRQKYVDYPNELTLLSWSSVNDTRLTSLIDEITHYNKIDHTHYKKRIYSLRKINDLLTKALMNSDYGEQILALLQTTKSNIPHTLKFVISQKIESEFQFYLTSDPQQLEDVKNNYFSQPGHLGQDYYAEMIDPHHRLSAWSEKNWKDSEWRDQSFATYLGHASQLEEDMRQAIYLDKYQREQVEVISDNNFDLKYKQTGLKVEDGYHLYAMDKKHFHFYLHKEYNEECGKRTFHHSSFLSGKHVICAGGVVIKDNHIARINNFTGHYTSTPLQLLDVITKLSRKKILDTENANFEVSVFGIKDSNQPFSFSVFQKLCKSILPVHSNDSDSILIKKNKIRQVNHAHPDNIAIAGMINEFIHFANKDRFVKRKSRAHYFFPAKQEKTMLDANLEPQNTSVIIGLRNS